MLMLSKRYESTEEVGHKRRHVDNKFHIYLKETRDFKAGSADHVSIGTVDAIQVTVQSTPLKNNRVTVV